MPSVTAVVCAHNPPEIFRGILNRLCAHGLSTLLVDDGSKPPLGAAGFGTGSCPRVLTCAGNIGLAAARNYALANIDTEWVLFVDADVMPDDSFLAGLPQLLAETGADGIGFHVREFHTRSDWDFYRAHERRSLTDGGPREWVSGLLCAYRTRCLRAVGGFDRRFRTNGEDVDLGFRLSRTGFRLIQLAEICGTHYRKDSLSSFLRMQYRYAFTAKLVDRSRYFPGGKSGPLAAARPLFHFSSLGPQLRLILGFLAKRPYAFYLPPLVVTVMLAGAFRGHSAYRSIEHSNFAEPAVQYAGNAGEMGAIKASGNYVAKSHG